MPDLYEASYNRDAEFACFEKIENKKTPDKYQGFFN
jgi:hypothetical protein